MEKNNLNPIYLQEGIDILAFLEFLKKADPRKFRSFMKKINNAYAEIMLKAQKSGLQLNATGTQARPIFRGIV